MTSLAVLYASDYGFMNVPVESPACTLPDKMTCLQVQGLE